MKKTAVNTATVLMTCSALVVGGLALRSALLSQRQIEVPEYQEIGSWEQISGVGQTLGSKDATIVIVVFSDFQCPSCAAASRQLAEIREQAPNEVAVVFRHFPLVDIHPLALAAANAAECAGAQGHFRAYHDALFERQDSLGIISWSEFASDALVPDLIEFDRCVEEMQFLDVVQRDIAMGTKVGIWGTPTFIINGKMVVGVPALQDVRRWMFEGSKGQNEASDT